MDVQTVTFALTGFGLVVSIVGIAIAGATFLRSMKADLKAEMGKLDSKIDKLDTKVDKLETKVDDGFDKVDGRLVEMRNENRGELADVRAGLRALEQRFFEILLPRAPAASGTDDA